MRRSIDHGISKSRFGIVIISPAYIKKGWTAYELDGIVSSVVNRTQKMLPLWHDISSKQVLEFSPSLADKVARRTETSKISDIAEEICRLLRE